MPTKLALALVCVLALSAPAAVPAKGFTRVALVGSGGDWVEVRGSESRIDGLLSRRGALARPRGGYLRLFFVGPGDFPANPARYYPDGRCVALDWPRYETTCRRVSATLLRPAHALARFRVRPTVLSRITHSGYRRFAVHILRSPVELALVRRGRASSRPSRCHAFAGRWRGPAAPLRPRRFDVCSGGVFADGRLHPLGGGVWEWLRLNAGPPA